MPRLVEDAAVRHADTEALVDGDGEAHVRPAGPEVDRYARGFVAAGVKAGDRVGMWAPNCAEWMLAALGVLRAGGVIVPLNTRFKGGEAAYILRNAGANVLGDGPRLPRVRLPGHAGGGGRRSVAAVLLFRDEGADDGGPSLTPLLGLEEFLADGERRRRGR